jgi:thiol-disulfide isomerase/thioredoxin
MSLARRQCLFAGASMVLAPGVSHAVAARPGERIEWPEIRLRDGSTWSAASWQGLPAVVVFWATWCPYCERHNAHVEGLHRTLAGRQLRILGAVIDGDAAGLGRYMARHGFTFPVTLDAQALRSRLTTRRSVPVTCVIDADSRLKQIIPGEMFEADVLQLAGLAAPGRT